MFQTIFLYVRWKKRQKKLGEIITMKKSMCFLNDMHSIRKHKLQNVKIRLEDMKLIIFNLQNSRLQNLTSLITQKN